MKKNEKEVKTMVLNASKREGSTQTPTENPETKEERSTEGHSKYNVTQDMPFTIKLF